MFLNQNQIEYQLEMQILKEHLEIFQKGYIGENPVSLAIISVLIKKHQYQLNRIIMNYEFLQSQQDILIKRKSLELARASESIFSCIRYRKIKTIREEIKLLAIEQKRLKAKIQDANQLYQDWENLKNTK